MDLARMPIRADTRNGSQSLGSPERRSAFFESEDPRQPLPTKTADGKKLGNSVVTDDGKRCSAFTRGQGEPPKPGAPPPGPVASGPGGADSVRLLDIETGRVVSETDLDGTAFVGLVPGSNNCVCEAADGMIVIRDLRNGRELRRILLRPTVLVVKPSPLGASPLRPPPPRLTPDGTRLMKAIPGLGFALSILPRAKSPDTSRTRTASFAPINRSRWRLPGAPRRFTHSEMSRCGGCPLPAPPAKLLLEGEEPLGPHARRAGDRLGRRRCGSVPPFGPRIGEPACNLRRECR